jgi:hypothetical protein
MDTALTQAQKSTLLKLEAIAKAPIIERHAGEIVAGLSQEILPLEI